MRNQANILNSAPARYIRSMTHAHHFTTELFHDLLDPRLTAIEICMRHELAIDELAALVRSQLAARKNSFHKSARY